MHLSTDIAGQVGSACAFGIYLKYIGVLGLKTTPKVSDILWQNRIKAYRYSDIFARKRAG